MRKHYINVVGWLQGELGNNIFKWGFWPTRGGSNVTGEMGGKARESLTLDEGMFCPVLFDFFTSFVLSKILFIILGRTLYYGGQF